ncbi:putative SOS response-associated peptidase YedK [Planctomycetes bacterium CA13]|uniref:Abasic site processing protein n=1 Tax=Novipirellula herctigrandis TaxID=2527986 RepID=A0A5C5YW00_9BACT|nr:putative SOS response-associated peptidase YedK [Planctomycetes bacterium CA13]
MCGRFTLRISHTNLQRFFQLKDSVVDLSPRYNIAPTQTILAIVRGSNDRSRRTVRMIWGLVPPWSDDVRIGARMINARAETVDEKPSFKQPLKHNRCLIPADGYYEWKKVSDGKQPFLMHRPDEGPFAFAGLWQRNRKASGDGGEIVTCTVITTNANQRTEDVHDRMPVILDVDDYDQWLDPDFSDSETLKGLLRPAPEELLVVTAVDREVNNARNDNAKCVEPV